MKAKYLPVIVFLMMIGCKKEAASPMSDIQGTWELASVDGGWVGHQEYAPGNGNTYSFSGNSYSQKIKTTDTTHRFAGTFVIYTAKPCDFASEQTLIEFDNSGFPDSFSLSDGSLRIGTTECMADGYIATYRKIR